MASIDANKQEVSLSSELIIALANQIMGGGKLLFTNRANRDAVYKEARKFVGRHLTRSSIRNQLLDPRYTVEGSHLPDKGLGNDYQHFHSVLYRLEVSRW